MFMVKKVFLSDFWMKSPCQLMIFNSLLGKLVIANEQGEKKVSIYTPSGIVVGKDVYFKDVMNELKNGLYIVNDKKYYLKK